MSQAKIILYCYLFMVGIALAMKITPPESWVVPLWIATLLASLLAFIYMIRWQRSNPRSPALNRRAFVALAAAGCLLGAARYASHIHVPERPYGSVMAQGNQAKWNPLRELNATSMLSVRPRSAVGPQPVQLRLVGELRALYPVKDANGQPTMDAEGRWKMTEVRVPQTCDVTVPAECPAGAAIPLEKPFSSISTIENLSEASKAVELDILQKPNRTSAFARSGRNTAPVTILGRITADPWIYSFKTILTVTPALIQYQADGPFFEIEQGNIRVTINPDQPNYKQLSQSAAYGYDVWIHGELQAPPGSANPGAFSQKNYLLTQYVEGQMNLRTTEEEPVPMLAICPEGGAMRQGNWLVEFSLELRDNLLRVIKQTMPYPDSSFLGAVTLGLRYGMADTETVFSDDHADAPVKPLFGTVEGSNQLISYEFQSAGINHVLAVSGLHVTIITALFVGIFALLRISRRAYVPIVVLVLIIFAIITGARPSTMRAVIMNSLFLITWGYMHQSLRASALLGVPVAAFMILVYNPAMLIDPSFTLSFGAILSLALLTQPGYEFLRQFRGNDLLALFIAVAVMTGALMHTWFLANRWQFWFLLALFITSIFAVSRLLTRKGVKLIGNYGFENIPQGAAIFIAAQFGIQFGMMMPLSAFYFCRWPFAGAYANFIAIPLIGIIIQLGMLASIIGLIPGIGIYLALLMNGANWFASTAFILLGHYSSLWFPYPFVRKLTVPKLGVYYILLALLIWHRPLWEFLKPRWQSLAAPLRRRLSIVALVLACITAVAGLRWHLGTSAELGKLRITALSVAYSSAILIQTPEGRYILVDAGMVQTEMSRRNDAVRTILPFMSAHNMLDLEALILSAPSRERIAGAASIVDLCRVDRLIVPKSLQPSMPKDLLDVLNRRGPSLVNRIADSVVAVEVVSKSQILIEEQVKGKTFRLEAILPDDPALAQSHPLVLRVVYGKFSALLPSDLSLQQQQALAAQFPDAVDTEVLVAPSRGVFLMNMMSESDDSDQITMDFLKAADPEKVIFEFGNPKPVVGMFGRDAVGSHSRSRRLAEDHVGVDNVFVTDRDGSILVETDGETWTINSHAAQQRIGEALSSVSEIEIGF